MRLRGPLLSIVPHVLIAAICVTSALIVRQWAYATTFRLYLDGRADDRTHSAATQRFDLEGRFVVPKILMHDDRAAFRTAIGHDSTIRAAIRGTAGSGVEVRLRQHGVERVVARAVDLKAPMEIAVPFPQGTGEIEIAAHGDVTWADLRVERGMHLGRPFAGLLVEIGLLVVVIRRAHLAGRRALGRGRRVWLSLLTASGSLAVSLVLLEVGLRAVGSRVSPGISVLRHDLGEATDDPRWQQTSRYGQRLRPDVDAPSEWRYGDIIRMGFVPPAVGEGVVHRYPFHADSEGFRNDAPRDPIAIAALGDSFTDALTMRREDAWPARLEAALGVPVQNYGTAGFGPQQERLVLEDFALRHHPRVVILAFFAGNDFRDAEAFESVQRAEKQPDLPKLGWPVKPIFTRMDTWFLGSAVQAATRVLARPSDVPPDVATATARLTSPATATGAVASFDRGVFTVAVQSRVLRWAFMPPYLNLLNFDEHDLSARRGWTLIQENLRAMQQESRAAGAEFIVAFIPFKSQVYLPLLDRSLDRPSLAAALHFSLRDRPNAPDVDRLMRNRLVENDMMARFCQDAGIPMLDLTPILQARVEAGEQMYFADDSHLNEAGEAELASALAAMLASRGSMAALNAPR